ncbi:hypothetical protein ACVWWG_003455 [Bradyrhizobium sp. LB7.2]
MSVEITTSWGAELGRIAGGVHLGGDLGIADAQLEAIGADRLQMGAAHHARDLVAGAGQPDRDMAADGARAENADAHGVMSRPWSLECRPAAA